MSNLSAKDRKAAAELDALYAELPTIACKGGCAITCGAIPLTDLEARRLQVATHRKPRTFIATVTGDGPPREAQRCIYLTADDRCSAYAIRPLVCRAFGLVKMMSCMRGCVPDRWLNDLDFVRIAQAIERIGGGRVLRTTPEGLVHEPGESFNRLIPKRAAAEIEADSERTRNLRALHGGRILCAVTRQDDQS